MRVLIRAEKLERNKEMVEGGRMEREDRLSMKMREVELAMRREAEKRRREEREAEEMQRMSVEESRSREVELSYRDWQQRVQCSERQQALAKSLFATDTDDEEEDQGGWYTAALHRVEPEVGQGSWRELVHYGLRQWEASEDTSPLAQGVHQLEQWAQKRQRGQDYWNGGGGQPPASEPSATPAASRSLPPVAAPGSALSEQQLLVR